jgi:hypothetical protein
MRRTSFVGALLAMAVGAVFAFAIHGSPGYLQLQTAGVIVMIGGAADLIIRFLISDSPLLSPQAAEVAAVVEPLGDPVLDSAGNPVIVPEAAAQEVWPLTVPPTDPATAVILPEEAAAEPWQHNGAIPAAQGPVHYQNAAGEGGLPDTPQAPVALTTITGRPVRPRGRGVRRPGSARRWLS